MPPAWYLDSARVAIIEVQRRSRCATERRRATACKCASGCAQAPLHPPTHGDRQTPSNGRCRPLPRHRSCGPKGQATWPQTKPPHPPQETIKKENKIQRQHLEAQLAAGRIAPYDPPRPPPPQSVLDQVRPRASGQGRGRGLPSDDSPPG